MSRKLDNKKVDKRIKELVGNEYIRLGKYVDAKTKMLVQHTTCGNKYEVDWSHFKAGRRCPSCAFKRKQVKSLNNKKVDDMIKKLARDEYTRLGEYKNSNTKILIKHNTCGNEYKVTWNNFQRGSRCPKCFGNAKLSNQTVNERIKILGGDEYIKLSEYVNANEKILIKHKVCGYEHYSLFNSFQRGLRCPKCSGNLKLNNEIVDERMFELTNGEYFRLSNYKNANTKILIMHITCRSEYKATWRSFQSGTRCPKCKESKGEKEISTILNSLNITYTSQKRFPECKHKNTLPFDFYVHNKKSKLLIEFDGRQHFESVEIFGGEEAFRDTQLRDQIKTKFALSKNIPLLRIPYTEQDNIEQILTNKLKELNFI